MPVLVYSKFEEEPINTECASIETPFAKYSSIDFYAQ